MRDTIITKKMILHIRFNTSAFLSNYKRNDLLNSRLRLYCIFIGRFPRENFNFIEQLNKMQYLSNGYSTQTLKDIYPTLNEKVTRKDEGNPQSNKDTDEILLYDVVYASIDHKGENDENI